MSKRSKTVTKGHSAPTAKTGQSSSLTEKRKQTVTGHWIGDKPILPTSKMTGTQRDYLLKTNMNIQHTSMEQFGKRAKTFAKTLPVERKIVEATNAELRSHKSFAFQQSSHMIHTQRADLWLRRSPQRKLDPSSSAASDYRKEVAKDLDTAKVRRRQGATGDKNYDSLMDLMVGGKQGPLTFEQSKLGVQAAGAGHQILRGVRDKETGGDYSKTRVGQVGRKGHPTQSPTGVDLSGDKDSQKRDSKGVSVFMGTSGSTSDVVRSHHAATRNVQKNLSSGTGFGVSGVSEHNTNVATRRLALKWMRTGAPAQNVMAGIQKNLNTPEQQRISKGPVETTQTHTMSEVADAVTKTRNILKPKTGK